MVLVKVAIVFSLLFQPVSICAVETDILTLGFLSPWEKGHLLAQTAGSGIVVGIQEVGQRQILPGYTIEWVFRDDYCEPRWGMKMAVELWASVQQLDGIIGSVCSVVCQPVSLLAASLNIPVVSWGAQVLNYPTNACILPLVESKDHG